MLLNFLKGFIESWTRTTKVLAWILGVISETSAAFKPLNFESAPKNLIWIFKPFSSAWFEIQKWLQPFWVAGYHGFHPFHLQECKHQQINKKVKLKIALKYSKFHLTLLLRSLNVCKHFFSRLSETTPETRKNRRMVVREKARGRVREKSKGKSCTWKAF